MARVFVALVAVVLALTLTEAYKIHSGNVETQFQWMSFKNKFEKAYSATEEEYRFGVFTANLERAAQMNIENGEEAYGVTKFSDLTKEEFTKHYLGFKPTFPRPDWPVMEPASKPVGVPASFDWRKKGAVTPVKDQGQCGSCWAFSATEAIESGNFMSGNKLPILAPQQIVSCDKSSDQGCNGGDTVTAYAYVEKAGGLEAEATYPYRSGDTGVDGSCKFKEASIVASMANFTYATRPCTDSCTHQDETVLAANMLAQGPASICVNAGDNWQSYTKGVIKASCPGAYSDLDHCVQVVGLNTDSKGDTYWMVRNSWADSWGESGYINILFGKNLCGIADEATFVQAKKQL